MQTIHLAQDIRVLYITASSFPDGIMDALQQVHSLVPFGTGRKYFGISRPENNGAIVYRAAVEEQYEGEAEKLHCNALILPKGNYVGITIHNYMQNIGSIASTFQQLLQQPNLDPNGYCIEWYLNNKDVQCMVRLKDD